MTITPWIFVGIVVLVIGRFISHRKMNHLRAGDYSVVGHCLLFIAALFYIDNIVDYPEDFPTAEDHIALIIGYLIVFGVPAVLFYVMSNRRNKKMQQRYYNYHQLVVVQGITDVYRISGIMGFSVANVINDLEYMVQANMIPNVFGEIEEEYEDDEEDEGYEDKFSDEEPAPVTSNVPVPVTCSGCGAVSSVKPGKGAECEFCGNALYIPNS